MESLLAQGIELMLLGMGVVFTFLIVLVYCTMLMSWLLHRYQGQAVPDAATPLSAAVAPGTAAVDALTLQVIQDALRQHRARSGRG